MARAHRKIEVSTERVVAWGVMTAVTLFVLWQVYPDLVFRDTTPTHGDLGGHVHEPAFLRDHLLPHGRLSGWSQDWFTGYPSLTFYFPLGSLLIALLDFVLLPYNVALKLVSALGVVALPLCAYAFGRLNRCDRLTSTCFGVAVLPLLLHPTLIAAGGSIGSTTTGEYTYELSLALGLVVLGLARAGLRTGRHRALTAGLLAATVLLHLVPAVMVVVGMAVATLLPPARAKLRWTGSVMAVGGALVGFWVIPFVLRLQFTAGPDYPSAGPWTEWLFPVVMRPVLLVAVIGVVAMFMRDADERTEGDDLGLFLLVMTVISGAVFVLMPEGRVWNARFVAVWFLWLCLLAGNEVARLARALDESRRRKTRGRDVRRPMLARAVLPVVVFAAVVVLWDSRAGGGMLTKSTDAQEDVTKLPAFAYEGYESGPDRAGFAGFIDTVRSVAREHGCGRAHWEWDRDTWVELRVPLLWLVPYWTDGCMTVTHGLYAQSSPTYPFVDAANARLSPEATALFGERPFDVAAGIADLRVLGVRYFITAGTQTQQAADADPDLRPIAETKPVDGRFLKIYELPGVEVVEPLRYTPVVVPSIGSSRAMWEAASERWSDAGGARDVVVAADGPAGWPRRDRVPVDPPRRPTGAAEVSDVRDVRIEQDRVSFRVSRTGVPILVKVSYFPNWEAHGAEGPWRVTPNQMVVVPTSKTVTLRYGRTTVDGLGWLATFAGMGGLFLLGRRRPIGEPG